MPLAGPEILLYEKKDHIVTITLNRPERMNTFTIELFDLASEAWARFRDDDDARVAIITAAGTGHSLLEWISKNKQRGWPRILHLM